jgi:hypothetical protein
MRRSRTTTHMETREDQREIDRRAMVTLNDLEKRYICEADDCLRQGRHCWAHLNNPARHYPVERAQFQSWAIKINQGRATIEQPHWELQERLVKGGDVRERQARSKTKVKEKEEGNQSSWNDILEMTKVQIASQMASNMSIQQAQLLRREEPNYLQVRDQRPVFTGLQRLPSSSPIRDIDDAELIRQFFEWKVQRLDMDPIAQENWLETSRIVRQAGWSLKDLKAMEIEESKQHIEALQADIKAPIARQFRRELERFRKL